MPFTDDELCIVSMYDSGNRADTINAIADAVKHFDEAELDLDPDHLL